MLYFSREENGKRRRKRKIKLVRFIPVTKKYKDKQTTLLKIKINKRTYGFVKNKLHEITPVFFVANPVTG